MARLPILAGLLTASLMTQAAMPEWMTRVGGYCTLDACKQGWENATEFAVEQATALKEAVVEHPYYAAAITAGVFGAGYVAKRCYNARQRRQQEEQDRVFAEQLQLLLQDEEFAQELARVLNGQVSTVAIDTSNDAAMAQILELMLQDEEFARQLEAELNGQPQIRVQSVNAAHDAAMAERLSHELAMALREQHRQEEADLVYARTLVEA